jgi:hypothetical protein
MAPESLDRSAPHAAGDFLDGDHVLVDRALKKFDDTPHPGLLALVPGSIWFSLLVRNSARADRRKARLVAARKPVLAHPGRVADRPIGHRAPSLRSIETDEAKSTSVWSRNWSRDSILCSAPRTPCSAKIIPCSVKKFPVPLRREFVCKRLNLLAD